MKRQIGRHLGTRATKIFFMVMIIVWVLNLTIGAATGHQLGISKNGEFYGLEKQEDGEFVYICRRRGQTFTLKNITSPTVSYNATFYEVTIEEDGETFEWIAVVDGKGSQKRISVREDERTLWEGTYNTGTSELIDIDYATDDVIQWDGNYYAQELAPMLAGDTQEKWDYYFAQGVEISMFAPMVGMLVIFFRETLAKIECALAGLFYKSKNSEEELQPTPFLMGLIFVLGVTIYMMGTVYGIVLLNS